MNNNKNVKSKINIVKVMYLINTLIIIAIFVILIVKFQKSNNTENQNFNYKVFEYKIPSNLNVFTSNEHRFSIVNKSKWLVEIEILVDNNKQCINSLANDLSNLVGNIDVKKYNGIEFSIARVNENGKNILFCYYQTPSRYLYEVGIYNNDNSFDTSALEVISNIILNADYHEEREGQFYYHAPNC